MIDIEKSKNPELYKDSFFDYYTYKLNNMSNDKFENDE